MTMRIMSILAVAVVVLSGCTALREVDSSGQERLLAASGFQIRPADTAKKRAALAAMEPYKLHSHTKNGQIYYYYADPKDEQLYVGGSDQFAKYSGLLVKETMVNQQYWAATQNQMAAENLGLWGPWGPGGFGGATAPIRTLP